MDENRDQIITAEEMAELTLERFPNFLTVDFYGYELHIMYLVPYRVLVTLTQKIADNCFDEDGNYLPETLDYSVRATVVATYTNVQLPDDIEEQYYMLYATDLWQTVIDSISAEQFSIIQNCVIERIRTRNETNRAMFEKELRSAMDLLSGMSLQVADLFSGISKEDLAALTKAIGNSRIDEEKLVNAVVQAQNKNRAMSGVIQFPVAETVADDVPNNELVEEER